MVRKIMCVDVGGTRIKSAVLRTSTVDRRRAGYYCVD
jgi:hypothetical protein